MTPSVMTPSFARSPFLRPSHMPTAARWTCRKSGPAKRTRSRSAKRAALHDAVRLYQAHFQPLLSAELSAELAIARASPSPRHPPLSVRRRPRLFSASVYVLSTRDRLPPELQLARGDLVDIEGEGECVQATVLGGGREGVAVAVPGGGGGDRVLEGFAGGRVKVRLGRGTSGLAFERAAAALEGLGGEGKNSDMTRMLAMSFADADADRESFGETTMREGRVGEVADVDGDEDGSRWDAFARESFPNVSSSAIARVVRGLPSRVNASQRRAVKVALTRKLTLIQGPPGTGKTMTAAEVVCAAARLRVGRILVCAASNVAADNVLAAVLSAADAGMRVVRVGRAAAVEERFWDMCVESLVERDARVKKMREGGEWGREGRELEKEVAAGVVRGADVVVGTCVGCGRDEVQGAGFRLVVVDEATQATEPDVLIALVAAMEEGDREYQVVLVGDQCQLPPTTLSREKGEGGRGLETSLFSRLWQGGVQCQLLDVQYRMHPGIAIFPAMHFYAGRLKDGVRAQERRLPEGFQGEHEVAKMLKARVLMANMSHGREDCSILDNVAMSFSFYNVAEAHEVVKLVQFLLSSEPRYCDEKAFPASDAVNAFSSRAFSASDIGIISPYAAQVKLLKEQLRIRNIVTKGSVGQQGAVERIEVATVDGFQGREKNVIIVSAVRSNTGGEVGFLNDWRRLNVSLTRARVLLVVVGDRMTLRNEPHWRAWLEWVGHNGVVLECDAKMNRLGDASP